jgi:hypothetical protein
MMATLGEVSVVAGDALLPHVNQILSVVIEALDDKSAQSNLKREWALQLLSKVVRSTIMSVWPYFQHRRLLDLILSIMMNPGTPWNVRRQAMIALGTLGALDPMLHKMARLSGGSEEGFSALGQTPDELARFAAERFSVSLVFVVFGGTSQDDEDEFDAEFELQDDEQAAAAAGNEDEQTAATYALFTRTDQAMWLLDQDATRADLEGEGGDLDFVYPSAAPDTRLMPDGSPRLSSLARKSGLTGKWVAWLLLPAAAAKTTTLTARPGRPSRLRAQGRAAAARPPRGRWEARRRRC